ncbi:farnesoic acid 0-methyl transferase domain-containing protein [Phthorimaea operculella]|nr:farnesoic acid 0-methyl transferase domain-containing protein [Phthorimaea operculella]
MGRTVELKTTNHVKYQMYPVASGSMRFSVRAPNDAHLALTAGPYESNPCYEIIIGGWKNQKSVIRKTVDGNKEDKAEVDSAYILNAGEFRDFYVRWDGGVIGVHHKNSSEPFLKWEDPKPFSITHVGFLTAWGSTGSWEFDNGEKFDTPDKLEYRFRPVMNGYLDFDYCGPDSCDICLTSAPREGEPMYEVILGGWENTKSVIRLNKQLRDKKREQTPGIITPDKFKQFLLEWNNGRITLRDRNVNEMILEWSDPAPFPVTHFGVRSGYGAPAQWRLNHYFETPAPFYSPNHADFVWVEVKDGYFPAGAVVGGKDTSGEQIFVARARHQNDLIPGMLLLSHNKAYVPWNGKAHTKSQYEVLVGGSASWVPAHGDRVPENAYPAGETKEGETLFIGRAFHKGSLITGKVHKSHRTCYITYGGEEIPIKDYEILVA